MNIYSLVRPILFLLDPEVVHNITLKMLNILNRFNLLKQQYIPSAITHLMGMELPNPIGLAAGLDKNGECIDALAKFGFGFIEIGTVTPLPQKGNQKPRLFRIPQDQAIINKMGFNNNGIDHLIENVKKSKYKGILGINIGKNANTSVEKAIDDYIICLIKAYPYASYIVINISSPNTKNLRQLQNKNHLSELLNALQNKKKELAEQYNKNIPLLVKIAPDLTKEEIISIAQSLIQEKIDGVIATNTTIDKSSLIEESKKNLEGGLSGKPLKNQSNQVLSLLIEQLDDKIPVIGSGGVISGKDALEKLKLGASAVQIYTGFIYNGPRLIKDCVNQCTNPLSQ